MRLARTVFAFSLVALALSAPGAQATTFHSEKLTTEYTGTQVSTPTFTTTAGSIKCKKVDYTKWAEGTGITINLEMTYGECTAFGQAATVTSEGCRHWFDAGGTLQMQAFCDNLRVAGDLSTTYHGIIVHVPAGKCTVTIPDQSFSAATVSYANQGSGSTRDVLVTFDATNKITYAVDGPGTICGTAGEYKSEASYTGSITLKGFDPVLKSQVGIWVE